MLSFYYQHLKQLVYKVYFTGYQAVLLEYFVVILEQKFNFINMVFGCEDPSIFCFSNSLDLFCMAYHPLESSCYSSRSGRGWHQFGCKLLRNGVVSNLTHRMEPQALHIAAITCILWDFQGGKQVPFEIFFSKKYWLR